MKIKKRFNILLIITSFLWAGFVGAISFMEAPVKFQAPSLDLATGVDVGRHVFGALNKVEIVFCLVMLTLVFTLKEPLKLKVLSGFIAIIIAVETFWLLPVLDERAQLIIAGTPVSGGIEHLVYIIADAVKLFSLFAIGIIKLNKHLVIQPT